MCAGAWGGTSHSTHRQATSPKRFRRHNSYLSTLVVRTGCQLLGSAATGSRPPAAAARGSPARQARRTTCRCSSRCTLQRSQCIACRSAAPNNCRLKLCIGRAIERIGARAHRAHTAHLSQLQTSMHACTLKELSQSPWRSRGGRDGCLEVVQQHCRLNNFLEVDVQSEARPQQSSAAPIPLPLPCPAPSPLIVCRRSWRSSGAVGVGWVGATWFRCLGGG